jgi:DNA excision repair protein ERCC-2
MNFDLDQRKAALGVGEFAAFALGPRDAGDGGGAGLWRAQLGTHWHNELRARATAEHGIAAEFEVAVSGQIFHRGWTLTFTGRIDQLIRSAAALTLREIKTVTQPLPADEAELRRDYPEYFVQLATYLALGRSRLLHGPEAIGYPLTGDTAKNISLRGELVFVEAGSGLAQTIAVTVAEDALFRSQLERVVEFLELRLRARERLRGLRFRPAFERPRPGQETTLAELTATFERRPLVFFEAPTGFGKTGVLLEFALGQLRSGHFDRAIYLTSKSTGQLQVMRTLHAMTTPAECYLIGDTSVGGRGGNGEPLQATPVAAWHVRNKAEHCINHTFHCVRDNCSYLADAAARWPQSGLARFYLDEQHARDLDTLRQAGRNARICPYEITRAALAFNDVWIGDYNYVFAPRNRGLFFEQAGFVAPRTLLLIDEAHNLPARVADAYSHSLTATAAFAVRDALHRTRAPSPLVTAWGHWCHFLDQRRPTDAIAADVEDDARHLLEEVAKQIPATPLDYAALGPEVADALWSLPALLEDLSGAELPRLWWCPREGELALTCLDASSAIGATLREFGGVVLASATLTPVDGFATACGLDLPAADPARPNADLDAARPAFTAPERLGALNKRTTRKLYRQLTNAADLLRVEEARDAAAPALLRAHAPWRDGSYDVGVDVRVDTTFQHRSHHFAATATTVVALHNAARALANGASNGATPARSVAVFFPSYAYAEAIVRELATQAPTLRVALQPKLRDLSGQSAWVDQSLATADALFLVLGSSFAESIDALGGRVTHAMVVGPALPEVNAVQRARLAEATARGRSREAAFRQVYQMPGMIKVNQALGRLVRAPGQRARVLLQCRRFNEIGYAELLAPEYRGGAVICDDGALAAWLTAPLAPRASESPLLELR